MEFTYRIEVDDDHTPWGEPSLVKEERAKIAAGEWTPYGVIVSAVGPVVSEESVWGCVVATTTTGTFTDLSKIEDDYLRETAQGLAEQIESGYPALLRDKRAQIDAALSMLGHT